MTDTSPLRIAPIRGSVGDAAWQARVDLAAMAWNVALNLLSGEVAARSCAAYGAPASFGHGPLDWSAPLHNPGTADPSFRD